MSYIRSLEAFIAKLLKLRSPTVAKYSKPESSSFVCVCVCVRVCKRVTVCVLSCVLLSKWLWGKNVFVIVPSILPVDNTGN